MQLTAVIARKTKPQKGKFIPAAGPCSPILSYPVAPHKNDIYFPFCFVVFSQNVEVHKRIDFLSFLEMLPLSSTVLKLPRIYLGFKFPPPPQTWKFKLKRTLNEGRGGSLFFGKSQFSAGRRKKKKNKSRELQKADASHETFVRSNPLFPRKIKCWWKNAGQAGN